MRGEPAKFLLSSPSIRYISHHSQGNQEMRTLKRTRDDELIRCHFCCFVTRLCPALCDPMDCSLQGSSVRGVSQARTLNWVAIFFSRGSSLPRD